MVANICGGVAQLGEHLPCKQGVMSSNLTISTKVIRRISASRKSKTSERACASEIVFDLSEGYSTNTRDERCAERMRI